MNLKALSLLHSVGLQVNRMWSRNVRIALNATLKRRRLRGFLSLVARARDDVCVVSRTNGAGGVIVNQLLCSAVIFARIMIRPVIKRCTGVIFVTGHNRCQGLSTAHYLR